MSMYLYHGLVSIDKITVLTIFGMTTFFNEQAKKIYIYILVLLKIAVKKSNGLEMVFLNVINTSLVRKFLQ